MAGKYTKQELKEKLQSSAYHIVATEGMERCTVRRVSAGCGLSDPYIYQCYSDLPDLMQSAFMEIDKKIADCVYDALKHDVLNLITTDDAVKACVLLWRKYWKFLMEDPEKTIFYWRFYQSSYYTKELHDERLLNYRYFIKFIAKVGETYGLTQKIHLNVLVSNLIDNTVSVAVKLHLGFFKKEDIIEKRLFQSVFANLFHHLGLDVWDVCDSYFESDVI